MTEGQKRTLDNIREFTGAHGRSPTIRELMAIENCRSTTSVMQRLAALVEYGYLRKLADKRGRYVLADDAAEQRLRTYSTEELQAEISRRESRHLVKITDRSIGR